MSISFNAIEVIEITLYLQKIADRYICKPAKHPVEQLKGRE
jgi:hypothetical protein